MLFCGNELKARALERELEATETQNAELHRKIERLNERLSTSDRDQSVIGHQGDDLKASQQQIEELEDEIDQLQVQLQRSIEQRQSDVSGLEKELQSERKTGNIRADEAQRALSILRANLENEHLEAKQALEDEILVLETTLDDVEAES